MSRYFVARVEARVQILAGGEGASIAHWYYPVWGQGGGSWQVTFPASDGPITGTLRLFLHE